jgi:Uma2 family endonuclease
MSTLKQVVYYPDSDGKPMADNTLQFEWIVTLQGNLDLLFREDPNVFVAGDHLIYPTEGKDEVSLAPDVYVAFGRPKRHRGSYKVWEEGGVFPQVIFEVWSPGNRVSAMDEKRAFYEKHGAEEYYIIYPEHPSHVDAWRAVDGKFVPVADLAAWRSPRLGIRVQLLRGRLTLFRADGQRFFTFVELGAFAERETQRADNEARRAEQEKERAEQERAKAAQEKERADKLAARLRELGVDPDAV